MKYFNNFIAIWLPLAVTSFMIISVFNEETTLWVLSHAFFVSIFLHSFYIAVSEVVGLMLREKRLATIEIENQ